MTVDQPIADDIAIIVATLDHWEAVRDIRLEALLRDPQAFGSTYAEAIERPDDDWRARVSHPTRITFLALKGRTPVGIGGALHEDDHGDTTTGQITSLYVTPAHRQHGVGRRLMQAALDDLACDPAITRAILHVRPSQTAAQRLYASLGFVPVGEEDGEILMERPLR